MAIIRLKKKIKTQKKKKTKKSKKINSKFFRVYSATFYDPDTGECFVKYGVTKYSFNYRFKRIPYLYKDVVIVPVKKKYMEAESFAHEKLINYKYRPKKYFSGYTECYTIDSLKMQNHIMSSIKKMFK